LEEQVMELVVAAKFKSASSSIGPPPGMENLRPTRRTRASMLNEAQNVLNSKLAKELPDEAA
jgi:hypothetical protein